MLAGDGRRRLATPAVASWSRRATPTRRPASADGAADADGAAVEAAGDGRQDRASFSSPTTAAAEGRWRAA